MAPERVPVTEDEMIVETRDYLLSEHIFNPRATLAEIEAFVKAQKSTSVLKVTFNQGGKRRLIAEEKTLLSDDESNQVRRIAGMDYEVEVDEEEAKTQG